MTRKPRRNHVRILIYRAWAIGYDDLREGGVVPYMGGIDGYVPLRRVWFSSSFVWELTLENWNKQTKIYLQPSFISKKAPILVISGEKKQKTILSSTGKLYSWEVGLVQDKSSGVPEAHPYPNIPRAPPRDELEHSRVFKLFFSPEFQPNILAPIYVARQSTYRPGNSDGQLE